MFLGLGCNICEDDQQFVQVLYKCLYRIMVAFAECSNEVTQTVNNLEDNQWFLSFIIMASYPLTYYISSQ